MEVDYSNVIIKCLGKALKTTIKYICSGTIKFYESKGKDITAIVTKEKSTDVKRPCSVFICLGEKKIFFVKSDMRAIYEKISYENLLPIELDKKNTDLIHLHIKPSRKMKHPDIVKMTVSMKNRKILLNNLLCYYTIYYEYYYQKITSLPFKDEGKEVAEPKKEEKKGGKFHEYIYKNYSFYIKGKAIKKNKSTPGYHLNYVIEKKKGEKINEDDFFADECDLIVEISDQSPLCKFDNNKNNRDISYFAYSSVLNYLKNNLKSGKFWILKNEVFYKKINLNEDMSLWEGWRIDARTCEPEYLNLIFIFLRRKFIPPYFDTYQDFTIVLKEESSKENYEINPEANNVALLAANSLSIPMTSTVKDCELFLQAKVDALLVDEETLYFYQSTYGIYGEDIFTFGYELLSALISYFETTNVKEQVEPLKAVVESKKKKWNLVCSKWEFGSRNYEFLKKIKQEIRKIAAPTDNVKKRGENLVPPPDGEPAETPSTEGQQKHRGVNKFGLIWTQKLMRFIGFVLNGGLTDYKMNYDYFLKNVLDACQNTSNDIADLCYYTINLRELTSSHRNKLFQPKSIIHSLDPESLITYNSEPMNYCVASNFLFKYLEEAGSKFIATFLVNNCSNKLLKAIFENFKYGDNPNIITEKRNIISLITPLREIFEDNRQNPMTLLLACKNLCFLVKSENDKVHRIKLCDEGNVIKTIGTYLDEYDYDQQLTLCCLDLFGYIMNETQEKLNSLLYNYKGTGLMDKLLKFLQRPAVPGVYFSQRVMIKVLTILLNLTRNIKAQVREMFNTVEYQYVYKLLVELIVDDSRVSIIDPSEEESSILDFKIFYLIIVLTSKNEFAQNYLFNEFKFQEIIEMNSEKYLKQMKALVGLKEKASEAEMKCIGKKVYKFLEMVYYLIINNDERKKDIYVNCKNFMELKKYCDEKIATILNENDLKSDVVNMLSKVFMKLKEEYLL